VILCRLTIYIVTPIAFLMNGFLICRITLNHMYAGGMFRSGGVLLVLTSVSSGSWMELLYRAACSDFRRGTFGRIVVFSLYQAQTIGSDFAYRIVIIAPLCLRPSPLP
jgi:hypothetical protein